MTAITAPKIWDAPAARFWTAVAAVTLTRIALLALSPAELGPDEAQYWFWSRDLAFGYFSKPPLIAWAIGLSTAIFGDAEWAVRLTAPLFHGGAAAFIYLLARRIYGEAVGFWAGLGWLVMPGVDLSSFIIATDAPLLLFWSAALLVVYRLYERRGESGAGNGSRLLAFALLGALIGLGLLAKYAMIYFPVALAAATAASRQARAALLRPGLLLTAAVAALLIAPNIAWNAAHDFRTFAHTADNAHWNASLFHFNKLAQFLGAQLAVFGIIPAAAFLWFGLRPARTGYGAAADGFEKTLLAFVLAPLVVVSVQAFISRAHANWAATAYPAAIILTTAWLFRLRGVWLVKTSAALHGAVAVLFAVAVLNFALVDRLGASRAVRDVRGWRAQSDAIVSQADGYDAIVIDDRYLVGEALYYQRASGHEIVTIDANMHIENHFEAFKAFDPTRHRRVLFVTLLDDDAHVDYRFRNIVPLGPLTVRIGDLERTYQMFDISGYHQPGAPAP